MSLTERKVAVDKELLNTSSFIYPMSLEHSNTTCTFTCPVFEIKKVLYFLDFCLNDIIEYATEVVPTPLHSQISLPITGFEAKRYDEHMSLSFAHHILSVATPKKIIHNEALHMRAVSTIALSCVPREQAVKYLNQFILLYSKTITSEDTWLTMGVLAHALEPAMRFRHMHLKNKEVNPLDMVERIKGPIVRTHFIQVVQGARIINFTPEGKDHLVRGSTLRRIAACSDALQQILHTWRNASGSKLCSIIFRFVDAQKQIHPTLILEEFYHQSRKYFTVFALYAEHYVDSYERNEILCSLYKIIKMHCEKEYIKELHTRLHSGDSISVVLSSSYLRKLFSYELTLNYMHLSRINDYFLQTFEASCVQSANDCEQVIQFFASFQHFKHNVNHVRLRNWTFNKYVTYVKFFGSWIFSVFQIKDLFNPMNECWHICIHILNTKLNNKMFAKLNPRYHGKCIEQLCKSGTTFRTKSEVVQAYDFLTQFMRTKIL